MKFTKEGRHLYEKQLEDVIFRTMKESDAMIREAIREGRFGLKDMPDADLIEFSKDCWDLTPTPSWLEKTE